MLDRLIARGFLGRGNPKDGLFSDRGFGVAGASADVGSSALCEMDVLNARHDDCGADILLQDGR